MGLCNGEPVDEKLFTSFAREMGLRVSEFKPQNLANTQWTFATVNQVDKKLFTA